MTRTVKWVSAGALLIAGGCGVGDDLHAADTSPAGTGGTSGAGGSASGTAGSSGATAGGGGAQATGGASGSSGASGAAPTTGGASGTSGGGGSPAGAGGTSGGGGSKSDAGAGGTSSMGGNGGAGASGSPGGGAGSGGPSAGGGQAGSGGEAGSASAGGGQAGSGGEVGGSASGGAGAGGASAGSGGDGGLLGSVTSTTFLGPTGVGPMGTYFLTDGDGPFVPAGDEIGITSLGVQSIELVTHATDGNLEWTTCLFPTFGDCGNGWADLGVESAQSNASVVIDPLGNLRTFWRAIDTGLTPSESNVFDFYWDESSHVTDLPDPHGNLAGNPSAAAAGIPGSPSYGRIDVLSLDDAGGLWHAAVVPPAPWDKIGDGYQFSPAATFDAEGDLHVFAVASDMTLVHFTQHAGSWSGPESWGGSFASSPSVTSWGSHRLDVVALDLGGEVRYRARRDDGSMAESWTLVSPLSSGFGPPAIASFGHGDLAVFAFRTADHALFYASLNPYGA